MSTPDLAREVSEKAWQVYLASLPEALHPFVLKHEAAFRVTHLDGLQQGVRWGAMLTERAARGQTRHS